MEPDLEARVAALEASVQTLISAGEQNAAALTLAKEAEAEVAELRTELAAFREQNTRLHNATRLDILDLRKRITALEERLSRLEVKVDAGFRAIDDALTGIRGRLDAAAAGQQLIVDMLTHLIGQSGPATA